MTTDDDIMKDIVVDDDDFVNNSTVMNGMADGSIKVKDNKEYSSKILGGQNPLPMYCAGVETLDLSNLSSYDQGCNEEFQNAMKNYFEGKATKDEALDLFYKAVTEKYPELTYLLSDKLRLTRRASLTKEPCLPYRNGGTVILTKTMCNKKLYSSNIPVGR